MSVVKIASRSLSSLFFAVFLSVCVGCHKQMGGHDIHFDSISIDTISKFIPNADSPQIALHLHVVYAKGKGAETINRKIIHQLFNHEVEASYHKNTDMASLILAMTQKFLHLYRQDYAEMYLNDKQFGANYALRYAVTSSIIESGRAFTYCLTHDILQGNNHTRQSNTFCIDKKTYRLLSLHDILPPGYEEDAKSEILQQLCAKFKASNEQQLAQQGIAFSRLSDLPTNFILYDNHITIIFNQDEIAPHGAGAVKIDIKRYTHGTDS